MSSPLSALQTWYRDQCNGDWEHQHGIEIGTLDNPGWHVRIDLPVEYKNLRPFEETQCESGPDEWMRCRVIDGRFEGWGGPTMLEQIIESFLNWNRTT